MRAVAASSWELVPRPAVFFSFHSGGKKTKIRESQLADFGAFRIMIAMRF